MNKEPSILLTPKLRFLADPARASAHSDTIASPAFIAAASAALLEYQTRVCSVEPALLTIAAAKLKGAQEYLNVLLNLGLPEAASTTVVDFGLTPPEQALDAPYQPARKK